MVVCGFIFDIIVYNVALADEGANLEAFNVTASFDKGSTTLTQSRINVSEIPDGKGVEFDTDTAKVRQEFEGNVLTLQARILDEKIGFAEIEWPIDIIEQLERMTECIFFANVFLVSEEADEADEPVGSMDVMVRLTPKCKNLIDDEIAADFEDIKEEVMQQVGSKDLFFILAQDKHLEACIGDLEYHKELPQLPMSLDMSKIAEFNGQLVPTPSVLNQCCSPDCCGLKRQTRKYGAKDRSCGVMSMLSKGKKKDPTDSCLICANNLSESESESIVTAEDENDFRELVWKDPKPVRPCLSTPPPELLENRPVHPRSCPVCNTNVDWLPSYTPCPKCGYKAVPHVQDLPYSHEVKAAEILRDFYYREGSSDPIDCRASVYQQGEEDDDNDCECPQSSNCNNSRVRRACKYLFKGNFDLCEAKKKHAQPPQYSKPLQQVFCNLKRIFDQVDLLLPDENKERCSKILNDYEEKEIKHNILGDARYQPCRDLDRIKERMSQCKPLDPEACPIKKKKKKASRKHCHCCGFDKSLKDNFKKNVPANKGWLWNLDPHTKEGWRPGAVRRPVRNIMSFFLKDFPPNTYGKKKIRCRQVPPPPPERPLLHICKRNGKVFLTFAPGENCNANPLKFAIEKNEETIKLRELRDDLLDQGFAKCTCFKPVSDCICRDKRELSKLLCCIMTEACLRDLCDVEEKLVLNDEYDSEVEYEFDFNPPPRVDQKLPKYKTNGAQFSTKDCVRSRAPAPVAKNQTGPRCA